MNIKSTVLFEAGGAGWSETLYMVEPQLDDAAAKMDAYLQYRRRVLSGGGPEGFPASIVGYRITNVDDPSQFTLYNETYEGTFKPDSGPGAVDMPWTGVVIQMRGANGGKRFLTLRGVPDNSIKNTYKGASFPADFDKALSEWRRHVVAAPFYVQKLNTTNVNALQTITSVAAGPTGLTVTSAAPHGLNDSDLIRFNNVRSTPTLTGQHPVVVLTNTTFLVPTFNLGVVLFLSGKFRKVVYEYSRITEAMALRKGSRKAGRPFFLLRGRR